MCEQFVCAEMHRFRPVGFNQARQFLQTLQDIGALNARDIA